MPPAARSAAAASLPPASAPAPAPASASVPASAPPAFAHASLTSLSASALLDELSSSLSACARVEGELTSLVGARGELERALSRSVPSFMEQVDALRRAHAGVSATVQTSGASAHALSSKVRELDLSASHVAQALARVESVLALRHTLTRVREKLTEGALASAADELHRSLFVQAPIENDGSFSSLLELERRARDELQAQVLQRCVRQARNAEAAAAQAASGGRASQNQGQPPVLESAALFKLARVWPKLGFHYRGLVLHCAQVRHECLSLIHRSGWSVSQQMEGALIDYPRYVRNMLDACHTCIGQHLLAVQATYGTGAQIRLLQELLTHVVDVEVASKMIGKFLDERKLREPPKGSTQPADDVCSRIKLINQRVLASSHAHNANDVSVSYYDPRDPTTSSPSSPLHMQRLDELLEEMRSLAHDMETFLKGMHSLARQSLEFMAEAVAKEQEAREEKANKLGWTDAQRAQADAKFTRVVSDPADLSALPSIQQQHDRVMTLLHRMLQDDKHKKNVIGVPLSDERSNMFAASKPAPPTDAPIPPAQLHLPPSSPFLVHGFGLDPNVATASQLYDVLLTLIGKYVLVEEYYMNVNVEKALAIDEHDGAAGSQVSDDEAALSGSTLGHDDLEEELLKAEQKAKERERMAQSGGLHGLASAAMTSLQSGHAAGGGVDPYLYLTGLGGALSGTGMPKSFVARFANHKTSTLVDNVCFLYKKCVQRALHTSNRDAIYAILLRVHENFNRKLRKVFEHCIAHYEARFGSKRKSSLSYALHQNPAAYLFPSSSHRSNLLGAWVSSAASGMGSVGGAPSLQDVRRKLRADVSLLLTVNNLDSTLENMQALLRYIEATMEDMFGETAAGAGAGGGAAGDATGAVASAASSSSNYSRGLSLDHLRDKVSDFHLSFHAFDDLIHRGLLLVSDNCWLRLLPRLALLQTHASDLYGQSEMSAAASELSEQILSGFIEVFRRDVCALAPLLNDNNFYQLVFLMAKRTAGFIEGMLLPSAATASLSYASSAASSSSSSSSRHGGSGSDSSAPCPLSFTQSGGVQFDQQVRTLSSFFTNDLAANLERHFQSNFFLTINSAREGKGGAATADLSQSPSSSTPWRVSYSGSAQARALFSRLAHMGSLLSVERPSEVLEYTERELFHLSKEEVRRVLALRKDFSEREINQLKL